MTSLCTVPRTVRIMLFLCSLHTCCHWSCCGAFQSNHATVLHPSVVPTTIFLRSPEPIPTRAGSLRARYPPPPPERRRLVSSWEGDDIRWVTRWRRRLRQSIFPPSHLGRRRQAGRTSIMVLSSIMFVYQTVTTILWIRRMHPNFWPSEAATIVWDVLWGTSVSGPLVLDGGHFPHLSPRQPHRFWTSGFLHCNWLHWILLQDAWQRLPAWLETGLGTPLYLTTILISQLAGNLAYSAWSLEVSTPCLGWGAGICGLCGLWYVCLHRMKSPLSSWPIGRRLAWMFLYGWVVAPGLSNAAHVGGLLGGFVAGALFGPRFSSNYGMRRKWSTAVIDSQEVPKDYQRAMGYDVKPGPGLVPLQILWGAVLVLAVSVPKLRAMPSLVWEMLLRPGSVSGSLART